MTTLSTCTYCGADADTQDHIVPVSYLRNKRRNGDHSIGTMVPCCRECNNLLGSKALFTVPERAEEIALCLETRYHKELNAPVWTEEELADLGPTLQKQIRAKQFLRDEVMERTRNALSVAHQLLDRANPIFVTS